MIDDAISFSWDSDPLYMQGVSIWAYKRSAYDDISVPMKSMFSKTPAKP